MKPHNRYGVTRALAVPLLSVALLATACGQAAEPAAEEPTEHNVTDALVLTYDGGILVLDGQTLEVVEDIPLDGFNRVNPAGDGRHVLVSTATGFRVLDATGATLLDDEFAAPKPGHVVHHADRTILFSDGTGEITVFDPHDLGDGLPETQTYAAEEAHHGVAVLLDNGELLVTLGDEESRSGLQVRDADGHEIARNEECPGVHGEAGAAHETIVVGCEDGLLMYHDGEFTKIDSPDEYGRIGNQAGDEGSHFVLGDYKTDPDAELERPERVSITDTETGQLEILDLGTAYTFRSLARGPHGEGLVLGTDGAIHVIDMAQAAVTRVLPVLAESWEEPLDWQQPRPTIFTRDHVAYVTDPAHGRLYAVDIESGEIVSETDLPEPVNEITGV